MTCAICVWTPARILECVESDAGEPIDCFREAVPDSPFKDRMVAALWNKWRFAICDSFNLCRWIQMLKDKANLIDARYQLILEEFDKQQAILSSIDSGWSEEYEDHNSATPTGKDETVNTHEDLPQTAGASESEWLSTRDKSEYSPGVTVKNDTTGSRKHTDNARLNVEKFKAVSDNMVNPYEMYAREFSSLFANYWNMDGECCD